MQQKHSLYFALVVLLHINALTGCDGKTNDASAPPQGQDTEKLLSSSVAQTYKNSPGQRPRQNPENLQSSSSEAQNLIVGEQIYKSTCSICHKSGLNGAPRMGKKNEWEARLEQGNEVLYERALNGYRGSKGSMPSRGSNPKLTEAEVKAAVDYMIMNAIPAWSVE